MKRHLQHIQYAFNGYRTAFKLLCGTRLAWVLVVPPIAYALTFLGSQFLGEAVSEKSTLVFNLWIDVDAWDFWGASYIGPFVSGFVKVMVRILFFLLMAYLSGTITLILLSPFLAFLSERTEQHLTGRNDYPFHLLQFVRDVVRGIGIALRNAVLQLGFTLFFFFIGFVPVVGWIISIVGSFVVPAYFYGFSFMDYIHERRRLSLAESVQEVRRHKWMAIVLGTPCWLAMFIPLIGSFFAAYAALFSTVAATAAMFEVPQYRNVKENKSLGTPTNVQLPR
ncbi:MAG: EI24 domain-containing protein [Salibacteraceae bacterium]